MATSKCSSCVYQHIMEIATTIMLNRKFPKDIGEQLVALLSNEEKTSMVRTSYNDTLSHWSITPSWEEQSSVGFEHLMIKQLGKLVNERWKNQMLQEDLSDEILISERKLLMTVIGVCRTAADCKKIFMVTHVDCITIWDEINGRRIFFRLVHSLDHNSRRQAQLFLTSSSIRSLFLEDKQQKKTIVPLSLKDYNKQTKEIKDDINRIISETRDNHSRLSEGQQETPFQFTGDIDSSVWNFLQKDNCPVIVSPALKGICAKMDRVFGILLCHG